ncbi:MAG: class B sortase [Clostridiales bacterium]|jgi:sortase B|nr:class B sortase [Clostridiales bacterium]
MSPKIRTALICVFSAALLFCMARAALILYSYISAAKLYKDLSGRVFAASPLPEPDSGTDGPSEETPAAPELPDRENIYIDFDTLIQENPDCVAWLWIPALDIKYPIMQSDDNREYLTTAFDGSYSACGSLFLDYRNKPDLTSSHSIIYGHNMYDGSMFGRLDAYADEEFFSANPDIYVFTPEGREIYQVFSHYITTEEHDSYRMEFESESGLADYARILKRYSWLDSDVELRNISRMLTLSTCVDDNSKRRVVHALLVCSEVKTLKP